MLFLIGVDVDVDSAMLSSSSVEGFQYSWFDAASTASSVTYNSLATLSKRGL